MLRRFSALLGMLLLVATLVALVWTVHQHRDAMRTDPDADPLTASGEAAAPSNSL